MRRAVSAIKARRNRNMPLRYNMLHECSAGLNEIEVRQLADKIVIIYNCVDYKSLMKYYGSDYSRMVLAFNSNTGSEYDIEEVFTPGSDLVYQQMSSLLRRSLGDDAIKKMLEFSDKDKRYWSHLFATKTGASKRQTEKFLRFGSGG